MESPLNNDGGGGGGWRQAMLWRRRKLSSMVAIGLAALALMLLACLLGVNIAMLVQLHNHSPSAEQATENTTAVTTAGTTTPAVTPLDPADVLHIPRPEMLSPTENMEKYQVFANYTARLRHSMNLEMDPCNNFYDYACGNHKEAISFQQLTVRNLQTILAQMERNSYVNRPRLPKPVKQAIHFYQTCLNAYSDWPAEIGDGKRLKRKMDALTDMLDVYFPAVDDEQDEPDEEADKYPSAITFSTAIAHLSRVEHVDTFLSIGIDTNWMDPHGDVPFALFFDQTTLLLPDAYYIQIWDQLREEYVDKFTTMIAAYSTFLGISPNATMIREDVEAIAQMELTIARELNTPGEQRRNYHRQYNYYDQRRANADFPNLDFGTLVQQSYQMPDGIDVDHHDRVANFVINEPRALNATMKFVFNREKVKPRTIYNYFFLRLLNANIDYLPAREKFKQLMRPSFDFQHLGMPKPAISRGGEMPDELPIEVAAAFASAQENVRAKCVWKNAALFPFANARIFLDGRLPRREEHVKLRTQLRTMVANVADGFKGMVAQLGWMGKHTKEGANAKIDNLVSNIAWPDFVEDDQALTSYYAGLQLDVEEQRSMGYTEMVDALQQFRQNQMYKLLFLANDTDRLDFGMPPSIVNAWYNPALNSITFPLGILSQPFFDANYPVAINYGALGIIAGHELTHGFDDQGVQWDGTGVLSTWMDEASQRGFDEMAQCVVDEYARFEPLPGMHIDGIMTQGENIADNGGLRAAYRAFRTHQGLYGPEPRLPDHLFQAFTHEQLFFLSYGQIWCSLPPKASELQEKLLLDPHSPAKYRILGSLQNFPAFRAAFHCPLASVYAPAEHCQVWESESVAELGIPPMPFPLRPLPIPSPSIADTEKYVEVAQMFEKSLDRSQNPCDNFYEFTCGRFRASDMPSFDRAQGDALGAMLDGLTRPWDEQAEVRPVVMAKQLYGQCVLTIPKFRAWQKGAKIAKAALERFAQATSLEFPLFNQNAVNENNNVSWPNATQLGRALGYLAGVEQVDTLLTAFVDVDWRLSQTNSTTHRLYIDQATISLPIAYFTIADVWSLIEEPYKHQIMVLLLNYATAIDARIDVDAVKEAVEEIAKFEYLLANRLLKGEEQRREQNGMYNPIALDAATISFVDLKDGFLRGLFSGSMSDSWLNRLFRLFRKKPPIFMEPALFEQYNHAFMAESTFGFTGRQLLNYLYFRLLLSYAEFIPARFAEKELNARQMEAGVPVELHGFEPVEMLRPLTEAERGGKTGDGSKQSLSIADALLTRYELRQPTFGKPRFEKRRRLPSMAQQQQHGQYGLLAELCGQYNMRDLPFANARVLVDEIFPNGWKRAEFREKIGTLISYVVDGFKSMLGQLEWLEREDGEKAMQKVVHLVRNIGYPDFVTDNAQLEAQFASLSWRNASDYFAMLEDIKQWQLDAKWNALLEVGNADRQQFGAAPAIVNAWYQPDMNSITFPLAILQPPFYDPDWPDSVNYGAIGAIAGHELTHGFDDEGIQWDEVGALHDWMGNRSQRGFRSMADCVVEEYGGFCPLNGTGLKPACINGWNTQGENIADNGGIIAAFRAYHDFVSFHGPEPQLPGTIAQQLSHDQLFFLSFARIWCEYPGYDYLDQTWAQLLLDPHSPAKYRVLGTLQNFPAFQNAFNCPADRQYTPKKHCNVWTDEAKPATGVPPMKSTKPPINVPDLKQAIGNKFYANSAKMFADSIDTSKDPCNNFYEYACGQFDGQMHFRNAQSESFSATFSALLQNMNDDSTFVPNQQSKLFFAKCLADVPKWSNLTANNQIVVDRMQKFANTTAIAFPMIDDPNDEHDEWQWPDANMLAASLGYLASEEGVDVLLATFVDTNWAEPQSKQPYALFIDQGPLMFPQKFYAEKLWPTIESVYMKSVKKILDKYAKIVGVDIEPAKLEKTAKEIAHFERTMANQLMTGSEELRRNFTRMYNPVMLADATDEVQWIDLVAYIRNVAQFASAEIKERVFHHQAKYPLIVTEREMLQRLQMAFKIGNQLELSAKHLLNYLHIRLLHSLSIYFESVSPFEQSKAISRQIYQILPEYEYVRPPIGQPRWEKSLFSLSEYWRRNSGAEVDKAYKDDDAINPVNPFLTLFGCTMYSMQMLPFQTARLYMDKLLPVGKQRRELRASVDTIIENVLIGFQSMLNQLEWMGSETRRKAMDKVNNLVRNIGYPDWIADDEQLVHYLANFPVSPAESANVNLIEMIDGIARWMQTKAFEPLAWTGHTNRSDFGAVPNIVNAWYQPMFNSITFPLAILVPPFFHPFAPTALNYGMLGAIAGHELTHAFDDSGTQFDAFGRLRVWMDEQSGASFQRMASCVIDQYSEFCPLQDGDGKQQWTPSCIDGYNTQGENIADNGGIRAAYRAFRNAMNLRGNERALPHPLIRQFDADQLFFLSFAQTWCQLPQSPESVWHQLVLDPHSPAKYRVLGTLQNFPAFQNAFNCPANSAYVPSKHCNVWVSDAKLLIGEPPAVATLPPLNIPNREREQLENVKYAEATAMLDQSVDNKQDPCNAFYEYACNEFQGPAGNNFIANDIHNLRTLIAALSGENLYDEIESIVQARNAFARCKQMMSDEQHFAKMLRDADLPRQMYQAFRAKTKLDFPLFAPSNDEEVGWPSVDQLSTALGMLSGTAMVDTLVSYAVDTNWADPDSIEMPYALFLDQPTLSFDTAIYQADVFPRHEGHLKTIVAAVLQSMAVYLGNDYKQENLDDAVQGILEFEYKIANNGSFFTADGWERQRHMYSMYNPMTLADAQTHFPFLNWATFMRELAVNGPTGVEHRMQQATFKFVVMEPTRLAQLGMALRDGNSDGFTAKQLLNYLFYRLIREYAAFIPPPPAATQIHKTPNIAASSSLILSRTTRMDDHLSVDFHLQQKVFSQFVHDAERFKHMRAGIKYRPPLGATRRLPTFEPKMLETAEMQFPVELECAEIVVSVMDMASSRLWLDQTYPTQNGRAKILSGGEKMMNSILLIFRSMIQQNGWMSPKAKAVAYQKLDRLVTNVGWPQLIVNNTLLREHYAPMVFSVPDNFAMILQDGKKFGNFRQLNYLLRSQAVDRSEFNGPLIFMNAVYQPQFNSLTLPASMLQQPFYDIDWPESMNFGMIGSILGHELSHGFDMHGIQWDSSGTLNKWLDQSSQVEFDQLAQCIVAEYNQFCPFPSDGGKQCVNGERTRDENIADNAGIFAAFRAYHVALEVEGPAKALPNDLFGQFTNDQLFFVAFAQPWCEMPNSGRIRRQLAADIHSPAKYRVLGTIRNFPAFRDSFNCPLHSTYTPEQQCQVWIAPVTAADKPIAPPAPNPLNLLTPRPIQSDDREYGPYRNALTFFKTSLNVSANPCSDFYEYACGRYEGPGAFVTGRLDNYKRIGVAIELIGEQPIGSALWKLQQFHRTCLHALPNLAALIADGNVVKQKVKDFADFTGLQFPLFSETSASAMPTAEQMAKALAWLSTIAGVDTLISPFVDVQLNVDGGHIAPQHYRLFIDQNTLPYSKAYYQPGTWEQIRPDYRTNILNLFTRFAAALGKQIDKDKFEIATDALLALELRFAREFSTSEDTRRDFGRWNADTWLSMNTADTLFPMLDWPTYGKHLTELANAGMEETTEWKSQFAYFIEKDQLTALSNALKGGADGKREPIVAEHLLNYLFFRLLLSNAEFLPKADDNTFAEYLQIVKEDILHTLNNPMNSGPSHLMLRRDRNRPDPFAVFAASELDASRECAQKSTTNALTYANARVFTDVLYPDVQERNGIRSAVKKLVQGVRHSYRAMMDELDWLDEGSRTEALAKIGNLQVNLGWPDWILENTALDAYYTPLAFADDGQDSFFAQLDKLQVFRQFLQLRLLNTQKFLVDRNDFLGPPGTVNAWYQPELNSITLPEGILREPYFHPAWPTSINYGGLGVVVGHELSHAFDDGGVQWDSVGLLHSWMARQAQRSFDKMAQCVVDEYSGFQVLDPSKYSPSNINGWQTQGENIADNAGIIASYRAYKMHIALNGPDPPLPDLVLSGLNHDQLFFLSYAQVWCRSMPSAEQLFRQILVDPHSPAKFRVFGPLQNFPAFRTAFNCPVGSAYAPQSKCSVWVPEHTDF